MKNLIILFYINILLQINFRKLEKERGGKQSGERRTEEEQAANRDAPAG